MNMAIYSLSAYGRSLYSRLSAAVDRMVRGESDFLKAKAIVPFFYYFLFFIAFTHLEGLNYLIAQGSAAFEPRLPVAWAEWFDYRTAVTAIFLSWVAGALVASIFPFARTARILAFLGFLQYHAFNASFGGPNHQWDHWLWISLILILLPSLDSDPSLKTRRTFSLIFWSAQAFLMLTYSMAGVGKLVYGVLQLAQGQANIFAPDAAALFAATQLNLMHESVPLANILIEHPWIGWLPFLAILELQTFAVVAALRPQLHRFWGACLILFHLFTFLTMRAVFTAPSALLLLFLVASPFAPGTHGVRDIVRAIPLVGSVARYLERRIDASVR